MHCKCCEGVCKAYLVPQPLTRNHSNFIAYPLVRLEVEGEFWVVALDDDLRGLLDRLRANTAHICGVVVMESLEVRRFCW